MAAAQELRVFCGSSGIDYQMLAGLAKIITGVCHYQHVVSSKTAAKGLIFLQFMRILHKYGRKETMVELLRHTCELKCLDPRDRLFALGAMSADPSTLPYPADYHKDVAVVYTDFAIHNVQDSEMLWWLLTLSGLQQTGNSRLASWVPDWRILGMQAIGSDFDNHACYLYDACGHQEGSMNIRIETSVEFPALTMSGAVIDTVETLWKIPNYGSYRKIGPILERMLFHFARNASRHVPWSTLWRTLICDESLLEDIEEQRATDADQEEVNIAVVVAIAIHYRRTSSKRIRPKLWKVIKEYMKLSDFEVFRTKSKRHARMGSCQYGKSFYRTLAVKRRRKTRLPAELNLSWIDEFNSSYLRFKRRLISNTKHKLNNAMVPFDFCKSLCVTASGKLGWVPSVAKPGDVVAILPLCVPAILRRFDQDSYQLVGLSYIHGVMDGEAVKDKNIFEDIRLV